MRQKNIRHFRPSRGLRPRGGISVASFALRPIGAALACLPLTSLADCALTSSSTVCSAAQTPYTSTIGTGPGTPSGFTVLIDKNAKVGTADINAISLGSNGSITINGGASVSATDNKSIPGLYGYGGNTVEFRDNNTLIVQQGASLSALGTASAAEVINPIGSGNTITNYGTISSTHTAAIWFDNKTGLNTVDNEATGVIETTVPDGNVIGSSQSSSVHFINKGMVKGNLYFAGGDDTLDLYTGSTITGSFDGGGGNNVINLWGAGSQAIPGDILRFQTLNKKDSGTWELTGSIAGGMTVNVDQGTLDLDGDNSTFSGAITVAPTGTLEGNSSSLPPRVTDNGLVRFDQATDGAYTGKIDGTGAVLKANSGTLTLGGQNTYTGGTYINQGTIQANADAALGGPSGGIALDGGTLRFGKSFDLSPTRALTLGATGGTLDTQTFDTTVSQAITGAGALSKSGSGTLILTGANAYTGGTTIDAGTVQLGNGGTSGAIVGDVTDNGTLAFNRSDTFEFGRSISGTGGLDQRGNGTVVLSGTNSYKGDTTVSAGALYVNGDQSAATGHTAVADGAVLGGGGTVGGNVTFADNAVLSPGRPGTAPGTLVIDGNLDLGGRSKLSFSLGQAGVVGGALNDLVKVKGDLLLNGILNVDTTPGGTFDPGIYRIVSYDGTLTGNGLAIGTIPSPNFYVQTSIGGQVNLVNTNGMTLNYWDGADGPKNDSAVNGGDGVWQNVNDNWTDQRGAENAPFTDRAFAIFETGHGTVTVDGSHGPVNVGGMQFSSDGYLVNGDELTLTGSADDPSHTVIRVGDGALDGAGYTATVDSVLGGASGLVKSDLGTLVLGGANTYTGDTRINGGTLQIASDANLGAADASLTVDGGTLHTTADITTSRPVTLDKGGGTFQTDENTTLTLAGEIGGTGRLSKTGDGTLLLLGTGRYAGGTTVGAGTLAIGDATHTDAALTGSGPVQVAADSTLGGYGRASGDVTNSGTIAVADAMPGFVAGGNGNFQINGNLTNAGLVRLGGRAPGNTLIVAGNYVGQNGVVALNSNLAGDGSTSDKLVLVGGVASGTSLLKVTNIGGAGALTTGDGIEVVQATSGATTGNNAFALIGGTVKAGPYAYYLAKSGASSGTGENWYLRNTVMQKEDLPLDVEQPAAAPGTPLPLTNAKADVANPVPVYRPEAALYAEAPGVARQLGLLQIDTFHDRQGDQSLLTETGSMPASWARSWGGHSSFGQKGDVAPSFNGGIWGTQIGQDLYAQRNADGSRNHYGFLLGFARATGNVNGFALGHADLGAGSMQLNAYNVGGYWTHSGAGAWYTDAIAMGSILTAHMESNDHVGASTQAGAFAGSVEAGMPIPVGDGVTLEPQAQFVWQWLSMDGFSDGISNVSSNDGNTFLGRIGARLQWALDTHGTLWKPYLRMNLLRAFGTPDRTSFDGATTLETRVGQTSGQIGTGVVVQMAKNGSVYATVNYTTNLGGERQRTVMGNAGVRWSW